MSSMRSGSKTLTSGLCSTSSSRSTAAPSAVMRLTGPASPAGVPKPTLSSCVCDPSVSLMTTRATRAPKRTSSRSLRVRDERPVQPKYTASNRFDLPAPLDPWTTVSPSPSTASARA